MRWLTLLALLGALVGASASVSVQRTQATECPGKKENRRIRRCALRNARLIGMKKQTDPRRAALFGEMPSSERCFLRRAALFGGLLS